jgi:5-methylcytosine-specific restriction endonuclease McrA
MRYSQADYFRRSQAWTDKSIEIKKRDKYLCQICIRGLYGTVNKYNYSNLSVHHAIPANVDPDRRLDNYNLITTCAVHHDMMERGTIPYEEVKVIIEEQEAAGEAETHPPGVSV